MPIIKIKSFIIACKEFWRKSYANLTSIKRRYLTSLFCLLLAYFSVFVEKSTESQLIEQFIFNEGLLGILALLAINTGTAYHISSRLTVIEIECGLSHIFTDTRKVIRYSLYEQFIMVSIYYFVLAAIPDSWWKDPHPFSVAALMSALLRYCLFLATVRTLDLADAALSASDNVTNVQKDEQ